MTSVFSLYSCAVEMLSSASILTVFLEFVPLNVVGHSVDPKKAHPCMIMCVLSHCASESVTSVGESVGK